MTEFQDSDMQKDEQSFNALVRRASSLGEREADRPSDEELHSYFAGTASNELIERIHDGLLRSKDFRLEMNQLAKDFASIEALVPVRPQGLSHVLKSIANFLSFGESFQFPVFALRFGATAASLVLVFLIGKQFINDGGDKQITLPVAIPAIDTVVPRPTSIKVDLELRDAKVDPSTLITFTTKGLSSDTDNIQKDKNSVYEDSLAITMIAELLDLNDTDYFLTPKKPNMVAAGSSFGKVLRIVDSGNNLITNLFSGDSSSGSITAWILGFPGGPTYQLHSVQLNLDTATVVWTDSLGMSLAVAFTKKSDSAVTRLNSTTVYIKPSK